MLETISDESKPAQPVNRYNSIKMDSEDLIAAALLAGCHGHQPLVSRP